MARASTHAQVLSYELLMRELEIGTMREVENLLIPHPPMRNRACRIMRELQRRAPAAGDDPKSYVGLRNFKERTPRSKKVY